MLSTRLLLGIALVAVAAAARAQTAPTVDAFPLRIEVGQSIAVCAAGFAICPADVRCDDTSVVSIGGSAGGPLLTGNRPGSTVCSVASAGGAGMRRVYRVTVVPKPARS